MRITKLKTLEALVTLRKAVHVPKSRAWCKPKPAAFMIQLSGSILLRLFDMGMFVYEKKEK